MAAIPLERLEGKYEILEKLQEGGMGAIYKVRHRLLGELRVIKVIRPHLEQDPLLKTRFRQEARAAAKLSHPHIAHLYDYTVDEDGAAFIVLEFIPGLTLGELMAAGELLPLDLALEVARQTLKAIGHVHRHGMAHRDISPDNLMLTADVDGRPLVKLLDLGLAKTVAAGSSQLTAAGVFVGKLRYAAPEQFDDPAQNPAADDRRRSDLYSFAVVLYELLTGKHPIAGATPSSLIAGHLFRPPLDFAESDPEGRVPETVRRAVLRGLAKSPEERFASAETFAAALDEDGKLDLASVDVRRILDLVRRQALPRLAPPPSRGSTQSRLDRQFAAEPTPSPEVSQSLGPTHVLPRPSGDQEEDQQHPLGGGGGELRYPPGGLRGDLPPETPARTGVLPRLVPAPGPPADEVELAVPEIEDLIAAGDFGGARRRLQELAAARPELRRPAELLGRVEEIEQIANRPRLRELLGRAQEEASHDRYPEALKELRQALELAPEDEQVRALYGATERAARRYQETAERERAIAERGEQIAGLLELGELEEAATTLQQAAESLGGHPRFSELRRRLDQRRSAIAAERRAAEAASVPPGVDSAELLRQARELRRRGQLTEAIARVRRAQQQAPQQRMIQVLLFELEHELAAQQQSEARETARRVAEEEIRQLVDGGEIEAAAERLPEALEVAGPTLVLRNLQDQVRRDLGAAGERRRQRGLRRQARADHLVAKARSRAQSDEFTSARVLLSQALEMVPDHPEALTLRTSVEACVRAREEELRQAEEVERTVASVRSLLEAGRPSDALATLSRATTRLGDHKELNTLHYEAARAKLDEAEVADVEQCKPTPGAEQPTDTVEIAEGLGPAPSAEVTVRIRSLAAEGKIGDAFEALQQALSDHGPSEELQGLRKQIGEAMLERDAEEEASGSRMIAIQPVAGDAAATPAVTPAALPLTAGTPAPPVSEATIPMEVTPSGLSDAGPRGAAPGADPWAATVVRRPAAGPAPGVPAAGSTRREKTAAPTAARSFDEISLDGMVDGAPSPAVPPPCQPQKPRREGLPGGPSSRKKLIAGLLAVIVLFLLGVVLSRLSSSRKTASAVEPVAVDVAGRALDPGFAVLDAVPWAEVTRIVPVSPAFPEAGAPGAAIAGEPIAEETPITPSRYTPVALELPPGHYRIILRYPPAGVSQELEIEIASGERIERRLSFEELDGQRYFEKVGY